MSIANDILQRIDLKTGEGVYYKKIDTWVDGSLMDDTKLGGKYVKKGNEYFVLSWVNDFPAILGVGTIGDGNNDDTEALQKLINSLGSGDTLIIDKRYLITSPLVIDKPITIKGKRGSSSFLIALNCDALHVKSSNVILENLNIGQAVRYTNALPNVYKGIVVKKDDNSRIDNIRFINTFVDGFEVAYEVVHLWDSEMQGIKSYACKFGFNVRNLSVNVELSNNSSFNCTSNGDYILDSIGINFTGDYQTEGWRLTNSFTYGASIGLYANHISHVSVQNCMFDFCTEIGISINDLCLNFNVTANYIALCGTNGYGVLLNNSTDSVFLRGTKIISNDIVVYDGATAEKGIYVSGEFDKYVTIDDNSIKGFYLYDIEAKDTLDQKTTIINNKCLSDLQTNIIGNYITSNNVGKVYYSLLTNIINIGNREISFSNSKPNPSDLSNGAIVFNSEPNVGEYVGWIRSDAEGSYKGFGVIKNDFREVGVSGDRPTYVDLGFQYFDTSLNKPIWAVNVTNPTAIIWHDSQGTIV